MNMGEFAALMNELEYTDEDELTIDANEMALSVVGVEVVDVFLDNDVTKSEVVINATKEEPAPILSFKSVNLEWVSRVAPRAIDIRITGDDVNVVAAWEAAFMAALKFGKKVNLHVEGAS